jgi:hypothetical protein
MGRHTGAAGVTASRRGGSRDSVNEQIRFNLAEAISRLANTGRADPTNANRLGIKVSRRP